MSPVAALLFALTGLFGFAPPPEAAAATRCGAVVSGQVRIGSAARVLSPVYGGTSRSRVTIGPSARFDNCAEVRASRVSAGPGVQTGHVFTDRLTAAPSAGFRSVQPSDAADHVECPIIAIEVLSTPPFEVSGRPECEPEYWSPNSASTFRENTRAASGGPRSIPPGDYGAVHVPDGATIALEPGGHTLCSLTLGAGAVVEARNDATLRVLGNLQLRDGSRLGTVGKLELEVHGDRLTIGNAATLSASTRALSARISSGADSRIAGPLCSRSLRLGDSARYGCSDASVPAPCFREVSSDVGLAATHSMRRPRARRSEEEIISGGAAAGDYDGDGHLDIAFAGGDSSTIRLFRNRGDGTFEDVSSSAGIERGGLPWTGPAFADYDGDGHLDLLFTGVRKARPLLFRNLGDGTFKDATTDARLRAKRRSFGASFADVDGDGDLDLFMANWKPSMTRRQKYEVFWRNEGNGYFVSASNNAGFGANSRHAPSSFTPIFTDLDDDGAPDLLLASDFGHSAIFRNQGDGRFELANSIWPAPIIPSDENGMGAAVGDYDNDGDMDWFVTSIWDPDGRSEGNWGTTGNRMYRNRGDGTFEDATDETGVRIGYWGWGACFADFNLDTHLDIFHVNGFDLGDERSDEFREDPSRLFLSNGDGTFLERSVELGIEDYEEGRGVVCFDYDSDGDVDILVANQDGPLALYRNDLTDRESRSKNFLSIETRGHAPNTRAIGARVSVQTPGTTQAREIRAGSNFASQDPALAHFGLGPHEVAESISVRWPGGATTVLNDVAGGQQLILEQP